MQSLEDAVASRGSLVYCVRRSADPFIVKIGTTTDLRSRLRKLRVPASDVLCVLSGGETEEAALHSKFQGDRVDFGSGVGRTEHFAVGDSLRQWIDSCRAAMDLDPLQ